MLRATLDVEGKGPKPKAPKRTVFRFYIFGTRLVIRMLGRCLLGGFGLSGSRAIAVLHKIAFPQSSTSPRHLMILSTPD